jgi:hypothetical protein
LLSIRGFRPYGVLARPWVIVFVKVGLEGAGFLTELTKLTELTELTNWQDDSGAGSRYAEVVRHFGFATRLVLEL